MPAHTLPDRPGRNVHPTGERKTRRSKEEVEAEREAQLKVLEDRMLAIEIAKEKIVQMNLREESEEGDLPIRLSCMLHKRSHTEVDTDSDECFDLKDAANSSDLDSSSESDQVTKTKTKVCRI